jgi:hypothetical protein
MDVTEEHRRVQISAPAPIVGDRTRVSSTAPARGCVRRRRSIPRADPARDGGSALRVRLPHHQLGGRSFDCTSVTVCRHSPPAVGRGAGKDDKTVLLILFRPTDPVLRRKDGSNPWSSSTTQTHHQPSCPTPRVGESWRGRHKPTEDKDRLPLWNAMKEDFLGDTLLSVNQEATEGGPVPMLHAGLDLSRKRVDVCVLGDDWPHRPESPRAHGHAHRGRTRKLRPSQARADRSRPPRGAGRPHRKRPTSTQAQAPATLPAGGAACTNDSTRANDRRPNACSSTSPS